VTIGGNGPVIEAGLGADVGVLSLLDAFVAASFRTAGAAFGLPAVFRARLPGTEGTAFLTALT
jgi:hypothetical protein